MTFYEQQFFGVLKYISKAFGKPYIEVASLHIYRVCCRSVVYTITKVALEPHSMLRGMSSDHFRIKFVLQAVFPKKILNPIDASYHCAGEQNSALIGGKKKMVSAVC